MHFLLKNYPSTSKGFRMSFMHEIADASKLVKLAMSDVLSKNSTKPLSGVTSMQNLGKQANRSRGFVSRKIPGKDDLLNFDLKPEYFPEDFFRWDITVTRGNDVRRHVFFATEKQMTYLAMATEWRIDSTFKLVSPPFTQLFSIHSTVNLGGKEKQYALAYVVMSGKRKEDYQQVFEEIVKTLEDEQGLTVKVKSFMLDYEVATWQAIREVFGDDIKIRGCWFHFSQAIIRKMHSLGLMGAYINRGEVHKFAKQLTVLPLLDADQIPVTFQYMVEKVCETYQYSVADYYNPDKRHSKEAPAMIQVFQYFESQWIDGKNFNPKDWSCYRKDVRTNNTVESWHSKVNKEGGNKDMHIFKLG